MHPLTTTITTAQKLRERAGYFYKYTCPDRSIDRSLRPTGRMPWNILHLWGFLYVRDAGRRTQDAGRKATKITGGLLHLFTVTIIRFSLYCPFKKEGNPPPPPHPRHLCAEPVQYIKKIKITNKRTTHYAIKILITIFCYGKGIKGKMCL